MEGIKAACYCRVSTKKEEQELSLENQVSFFKSYTQQHGLEIYTIYTDDGVSAKSLKKRDNFNRMVSDAKKGHFKKILVKDISRFARNTLDFLSVIRELKLYDVEVVFITANMSTSGNELTLTMLAAVAQEESGALSKRVKFGKMQSAKSGRVPSIVYGYDKVPHDKYNMLINQAEAGVVEQIFDLYVNTQMSSYQIAAKLNNDGIPTKRGPGYRWSQTVVCGILKNRLYIGEVCNGKSEIVDYILGKRVKHSQENWFVVHRPEFRIITDEMFRKAGTILAQRSNSYHQFDEDGKTRWKRPSVRYPLSNLLVCANDNYSFRRKTRSYKPSGYSYTYWTCSKRDYGVVVCDNSVKIDEKQMHGAILSFLNALFENQGSMQNTLREKIKSELNRKYGEQHRKDIQVAELKKLTSQRDKLMDLYLEDTFDKQVLCDKLTPINRRIGDISVALKLFESQKSIPLEMEKNLGKMLAMSQSDSEFLLDNGFLKSVFEKFVVQPDGRISAIIKKDMGTHSHLEIPFCHILDESKVTVPKQTNDI